MVRQPNVSAIITAYNYARFIGETILSVLDKTYRDFEIIAVELDGRPRVADRQVIG